MKERINFIPDHGVYKFRYFAASMGCGMAFGYAVAQAVLAYITGGV